LRKRKDNTDDKGKELNCCKYLCKIFIQKYQENNKGGTPFTGRCTPAKSMAKRGEKGSEAVSFIYKLGGYSFGVRR
jgi:hypothetical protein